MAFRGLLLEAVTRDEALKTLNRETQAEDGALDQYRNGKVVPRQYIRVYLTFKYHSKADRVLVRPLNPMELTLKGPLFDIRRRDCFEFDVDQVKALIEVRRQALARQRDKATGGRHPHPERVAILANYRQRKARRERNAAKNTAQWVETEVAAGRLTEIVQHPDTIRAWDRQEKSGAWDREEKSGPEKKNRMK